MKPVKLIACGACALCFAASVFAQQSSPGQSSGMPQSGRSGSPAASGSSASGTGAQSSQNTVTAQRGQSRKQTFDRLDANHDGSISRAEASAAPALVIIFAETDTDSSGGLSASEFDKVPLAYPDGSPVS
jgi:hypothetical protein